MRRFTHQILNTTSIVWYLSILIVLSIGWISREQRYLVAESGIGYWFGIIGGSLMLLLLIYPLRKRFRKWSVIGSVKSWFRLHMILGVLGPLIIIFHSGFKLGSLNSSVAFFCMLVVAISGLLGRMFYQRIHNGLYGRKLRHQEYYPKDTLVSLMRSCSTAKEVSLIREIGEIEGKLTNCHTGVNRSIRFYRSMKRQVGKLQRRVQASSLTGVKANKVLHRLHNLKSICVLGTNEILFSYWHVLHLPLFVMLVLSGIIHVVVVHFY